MKKKSKKFSKNHKKKFFRKKKSFQFCSKLHLLTKLRRFPPKSARITKSEIIKKSIFEKKGRFLQKKKFLGKKKFIFFEIFKFIRNSAVTHRDASKPPQISLSHFIRKSLQPPKNFQSDPIQGKSKIEKWPNRPKSPQTRRIRSFYETSR